MDSPFVGMIAALPYSFVPKDWARCNGQLVPTSQNSALYSLIGTTFGGSATVFNLPDLRGRTIVGSTVTSNGPGLGSYPQGQMGGLETVALNAATMPAHTHNSFVSGTAPVTGTITASLNVDGTNSGNANASNNYLANDISGGTGQIYSTSKNATLNSGAITVSQSLNATLTNTPVTVGPMGGSLPHENRMPYLAIQYCISLQGMYPSRS